MLWLFDLLLFSPINSLVRIALRLLFFTCLISTFCEHSQAASITISAAGYDTGTAPFHYRYDGYYNTFNFSGSFLGYSGNGSSSYIVNDANSITVRRFDLWTTVRVLDVPSFSMTRSGSSYNGSFYNSLLNARVYVTVFDPNDSDFDGIPDFSDDFYDPPPVPPPQLSKPLSANLGQFFTYSPSFQNSPTYFTATDLPPGISVNSGSGTISGTPTFSGYYNGLLTATKFRSASFNIPITIPSTLQSTPFSDDFSASVPNRYMPITTLPSFASMSVNNGVLRYASTSGSERGAYGAWLLNLPLPLSSSWQVTADVTMPSGWSPPFAYAGVGLRIEPYLFNDLFENNIFDGALGENCITLELDRSNQAPYANNVNLWFPTAKFEFSPTTSTSVTLRFVYDSTQKTISAFYRTSSTAAWISVGSPQNFNPSSTGSWAEAWGLTSSSSLQVTLFADTTSKNGTSGKVITLDNLSITAFTPPTITSPLTSSGTVAGSFSYQTTGTGNPTRYNLSGTLPTGLTFNSSTGQITGTPTQSGTFTVSLSATSGSYTGPSVSLRITIPALVGSYTTIPPLVGSYTISISSPGLPSGSVAFTYNPSTLRFSFSGGFLGITGSASGSYTINNANSVSFAAFTISTTVGNLSVPASSLARSGSSYSTSSFITLGGINREVTVSVTDPYDSDSDGIPDFSDEPSGYAASSQYSASYPASNAFDNNNSTAWHSKAGTTYPHVLAYDCGSARSVSVISLNQGWQPANSVQVLGSNDNANWTNLGTFSTSAGLNTLSLSSAQSFRYWAIRALTGNNTYWCVSEIRLGGYFFSSSPGATANGNEWSSDYTAAKAFDGNNSTAWHSKASSTYPHVLAYDCGSARSVSVISLNQGWQPANSVQVLGSNDNANWTNLGTFSTSAGLNTLSLSSAQSFRYWAIRAITGNNTHWCVSEIRLGGYFFSSSPGATANGNEWSSDYTAAKAFDGNNSTAWHSKASTTFPHILAYDCGSARSVSVISLNQGWQPANSVQVLGSNDNANWTNLGTFSTSAGLNTLSLSSAQSFRYWAIRAITGKNNGLWCVSEIRL